MTILEKIQQYLGEWAANAHGHETENHTFRSKSNPDVDYTTIRWSDGTYSCNCPGWTHAKDGKRFCKHVNKLGGKPVSA